MADPHGRGCCTAFFFDMFLPANYPHSVAEEYGAYQLWDTIQQVAFFINTVISGVAIMKFHGVGDSTKTPEEATALAMGRAFLATIFTLAVSTPFFKRVYTDHAGPSRALSGFLIAAGHFFEVLAGMASNAVALLYLGPIVCSVGGAVADPTRQVILQGFVDGGRPPATYGDVNLKETNQDGGGKLAGLLVGLLMIVYLIGVSAGGPADERAGLLRAMRYFVALSVVHVTCNAVAVRQLRLVKPARAGRSGDDNGDAPKRQHSRSFKRMFFPNLDHMVGSYPKYQFCSLFGALIEQPKGVVVDIVYWHYVWGVGDASKTPTEAQLLSMFIQGVTMVVALASGLPVLRRFFNGYEAEWWKPVSSILGLVADTILFVVAFQSDRPWIFYPTIVVARAIAAFGSTCGSYVNGSILPSLIRAEHRWNRDHNPCGAVANVDVAMANANQERLVKLSSQFFSIIFLYYLVWARTTPSLESLFTCFAVFQTLQLAARLGLYRYMPNLPRTSAAGPHAPRAEPLLAPRE